LRDLCQNLWGEKEKNISLDIYDFTKISQPTISKAKRINGMTTKLFCKLSAQLGFDSHEDLLVKLHPLLKTLPPDLPRNQVSPQRKHQSNVVIEKVELIAQYLQTLPAFPDSIDEKLKSEMRQVLANSENERYPFIFYHWRQLHPAIHWVDFYFLLAMRWLGRHGFRTLALITDDKLPSGGSVGSIAEIVKVVLGDEPITYTSVKRDEVKYKEFAYENVAIDALDAIWHLNEDTKAWIQYVPYWVNKQNEQAYFQIIWNRKYTKQHEYAHSYRKTNVVQIQTQDIDIDGAIAKSDGPPVCVEPLPCPSVRLWLSSNPRPTYQQVATILKYFASFDDIRLAIAGNVKGSDSHLKEEWVNLLDGNDDSRLFEAVRKLADLFEHLNNEYFKSKSNKY
jgi:hypothetical protein